MRRVAWALGLSIAMFACKSPAPNLEPNDAGTMPLNVRAELQTLCEAAASTVDASQRAMCAQSLAPRDGAKEEVVLKLHDDEAGYFLYYAHRSQFADAGMREADAGAGGSCAKLRAVWRFEASKMPSAMASPALVAASAACDKAPTLP